METTSYADLYDFVYANQFDVLDVLTHLTALDLLAEDADPLLLDERHHLRTLVQLIDDHSLDGWDDEHGRPVINDRNFAIRRNGGECNETSFRWFGETWWVS